MISAFNLRVAHTNNVTTAMEVYPAAISLHSADGTHAATAYNCQNLQRERVSLQSEPSRMEFSVRWREGVPSGLRLHDPRVSQGRVLAQPDLREPKGLMTMNCRY